MPAESEAQRRYMMGWLHNPKKMKGERPKMSKHEMEKFSSIKDHMPKGAALSPSGDIAEHRGKEIRAAFPRPIKAAGSRPDASAALPYRKPATAGGTDQVA